MSYILGTSLNSKKNVRIALTQIFGIGPQRDVKNCIMIGSYRGFRHNDGLPLRGQRTHTNAKTSRKRKILHILKQPIQ